MSVANIIGEVTTYLQVLYPSLVAKIGEEHAREEDAPPRVIWFLGPDQFGPAKLQATEPRPVRTRLAGLAAHCWAAAPRPVSDQQSVTADLEATEKLVNDVIAGMHQAVHGQFQVTRGQWVTPTKAGLGRACVLEFQVEIPVTYQPATTAPVTTETQTATIVFEPGGLAQPMGEGMGGGSGESGSPGL